LPRVTGHFLSIALGPQGRRAFEYINTGPQGRRACRIRLGSTKNILKNCYLVVVYLLDICIIKVFLINTKGIRT